MWWRQVVKYSSRRGLCCDKGYYDLYKGSYEKHATKFSHVDESGTASMVDVGDKDVTERKAKAAASVLVGPQVFSLIKANNVKKVMC